jgi:colicin import membrane protein
VAIERKSDKWISLVQSVVLHGVVVGALAYGFYAYKTMPKPVQPTLAVEASVVESTEPPSSAPAPPAPPPPEPEPEPAPEPPPPEDVGPPAPTPEEIQQREQAQREEQERQQRAEEERIALERKQKEEAEQKAREEERKRQEEEEKQKRLAEEKRKAEEKARQEARRKAEEARRQAEIQNELLKSMEAEERARAARSSDAYASWLAAIQARVQRAWIRPPGAGAGVVCDVRITQTPGGEVVGVQLGDCNADAAVRESIESAVYRASPLPPPPDPSLFERNMTFRFRPTD